MYVADILGSSEHHPERGQIFLKPFVGLELWTSNPGNVVSGEYYLKCVNWRAGVRCSAPATHWWRRLHRIDTSRLAHDLAFLTTFLNTNYGLWHSLCSNRMKRAMLCARRRAGAFIYASVCRVWADAIVPCSVFTRFRDIVNVFFPERVKVVLSVWQTKYKTRLHWLGTESKDRYSVFRRSNTKNLGIT